MRKGFKTYFDIEKFTSIIFKFDKHCGKLKNSCLSSWPTRENTRFIARWALSNSNPFSILIHEKRTICSVVER